MRCLALIVASVVVLAAFAQPAAAGPTDGGGGEAKGEAESLPSPDGGGEVVSRVGVGDGHSGGSSDQGPGERNPGGMESSQGLTTTHWRDTGVGCPHGEAQGRPVGDDPDGRIYELIRVDRSTEPPTETIMGADCFPNDDPPAASFPPPPPPTVEEITDVVRARIDPPPIKTNPDWGGVTGLESWFWYEGPEEVTATASIRGYSVTATATPTRFYWDPCADYTPPEGYRTNGPRGCRLLESTHPGQAPAHDSDGRTAAAQFLYETRGAYEIRHQVVWDGTWSFTGPDGAIASGTLATIRATSASPYVVEEIRSELRDGR